MNVIPHKIGEVIVNLSDCKVVPAQNGGKSYCYVDTKYTDDANKDRYCKGYMEMDGVDLVYPGDPLHDDPDSEYYYFSMNYTLRPGHTVKTTKVRLWELK